MNNVAAITCFLNFDKDSNNLNNFVKFKNSIEKQGVPLFVIEITPEGVVPILRRVCDKDKYITGETILPILIKGNALNVLSSRVPKEYKNIAWLNWGTIIRNENWAEEASCLLNDYKLVKIGKDSDHESPMVVKKDFFESIGLFDYDFCGNGNLLTFISANNDSLLDDNKLMADLYEENNLQIFYKILSYKKHCHDYFKGSVGYLDSTVENTSDNYSLSLDESINLLKDIDIGFNIHYNGLHELIALKNIFGCNYSTNLLNLLKKV